MCVIGLRAVKIWSKLRFFTQPGARLSQRVAFAGAWMLILRVSVRGLSMVRIIVLARILTPEAFGLVGIALLITELVNAFSQLGLSIALVQRKGDIRGYLDTAWVLQIVRGLTIGVIVIGTAPWVADFFNAPVAKPIVQVMGVVLVFRGLTNIGMVYLNKEHEVHKRFVYELSRNSADLIISVIAALILHNAWALVYGALGAGLVGVIVSYMIHPYRPRPKFDFQKAKELFNFGKWVFLTLPINYVFRKADIAIVGRFYGVVSLGLYSIARRVADMLVLETSTAAYGIAFPAYAKLQSNLIRLRQAFLAGIEAVAVVIFPIAVAVFILAPDFTPIVLGEQWVDAIPAMRVLGFAGAVHCLLYVGGSLFYGVGRPRLRFLMILIGTLVTVALLVPLAQAFRITGPAIALLIGNLSSVLVMLPVSGKLLGIKLRDWLHASFSPVTISLALAIVITAAKQAIGQVDLGEFILLLCVAAVVYAGFALLIWKLFRCGPMQILALLKSGPESSTEPVC